METFFLEKIEPFANAESSRPCASAAYVIDKIAPVESGMNLSKSFDDKSIVSPKTSMLEDENNITIEVELPGVNKESINVVNKENVISVSANRENPEIYKGNLCEMMYKVTFSLPPYAKNNEMKVKYTNGVLEIVTPKNISKPLKVS